MKKFLKIAAIIVGSIVTIAFLAWLIMPALPTKLLIKSKYKDNLEFLNCTTASYTHDNIETPEDFIEVEYKGMSVKMPSDMKKSLPDDYKNQDLVDRFYSDKEKNAENSVVFLEPEDSVFTSEEFESFKSIDYKTPENSYELWDLIYTVKFDDLSIFKHKSSEAMLAFAEIKNDVPHGSDLTVYKIETENAVGFIYMFGHSQKTEENEERYFYEVMLFDKNDLNDMHSVLIVSGDQETVWQILNSADIVK